MSHGRDPDFTNPKMNGQEVSGQTMNEQQAIAEELRTANLIAMLHYSADLAYKTETFDKQTARAMNRLYGTIRARLDAAEDADGLG